jgi:hypothetical protein
MLCDECHDTVTDRQRQRHYGVLPSPKVAGLPAREITSANGAGLEQLKAGDFPDYGVAALIHHNGQTSDP